MAARVAARYGSRRLFSSGSGKVLSEEERAAENAYFKVTSKVFYYCAMYGWTVCVLWFYSSTFASSEVFPSHFSCRVRVF